MFHEFLIDTTDTELDKLGVNNLNRTRCCIDLNHVIAYYENANDDDEIMTTLLLTSDHRLDVYCRYDEISELLKLL